MMRILITIVFLTPQPVPASVFLEATGLASQRAVMAGSGGAVPQMPRAFRVSRAATGYFPRRRIAT